MNTESKKNSNDLNLETKAAEDHSQEMADLLAEKRRLWSNLVWNLALERAGQVVRNRLVENNGLRTQPTSRLNIDNKVVEFKFELLKLAVAVLEKEDLCYRPKKKENVITVPKVHRLLNEGNFTILRPAIYFFLNNNPSLAARLNIVYDSYEDMRWEYQQQLKEWWKEHGRQPEVSEFAKFSGKSYGAIRERYVAKRYKVSDEERKLWETGPQEEEK